MKKQNGKNRLGVYMVAGSLALVLGLPSQVMAREGGFIGAGMGWSSNHVEMSSSALGALLPLQENLDMRLEWNQTRYGEEDYFDGALELKPTESLFTVGVSLRY